MDYTKVTELDWDYLIILDACRYDVFKEVYRDYFKDGELKKMISVGTNTPQWRDLTWKEKYPDIIYITANPYFSPSLYPHLVKKFYKIYEVYIDSLDEFYRIVFPDVLTRKAIKYIKFHHDKRAVIHYMQPHMPFITSGRTWKPLISSGQTVQHSKKEKIYHNFVRLLQKFGLAGEIGPLMEFPHKFRYYKRTFMRFIGIPRLNYYEKMLYGGFSEETIVSFYQENLQKALLEVQKLASFLHGKIIIAADHGECLGEYKNWGHWPGSHIRCLREVPCLTIDKRDGQEPKGYCPELVENRLRTLGYV